jgi:hypothetical protein
VTGAVAAGCGGGSSGGTPSSQPVTVPPVSKTPSASPTPTSASPSPTATTPAPPAPCLTSQLSLSLGQSQGAAGTFYQPIVLTNTGRTCTLFAYPGVSFVDSGGNQLGDSAERDPGKRATVTLHNGSQASALLRIPNAGNFPPSRCHPATSTSLKVYPPGQHDPLTVKDSQQICTTKAGRAGIGVMESGNNPT